MTAEDLDHWVSTVESSAAPDELESQRLRVTLRPLQDADVLALYAMAMSVESGSRWRFKGRTVPFPTFFDDLHTGTLCSYGVVGRTDAHAHGVVVAYRPQLELGHCFVAFARTSERPGRGEMAEGMYLLIEHLFRSFGLRKVYAEMTGPNVAELGLPAGPFVEEGRLRDHEFVDGAYVDHVFVSVLREDWERFATAFRPWARA